MKKKLSILIYSLAGGGAERVVSILLYELKEQYEITLVLMRDKIDYEVPKEIKIHFIEKSKPNEKGILKLFKLPYLGWKYKNFCRKNKIDISLSFMNRPVYIAIFSKLFGSGIPNIISERTTPSAMYEKRNLLSKVNKLLIRYLYPKSDFIITNSEGNRLDLIKNFDIDEKMVATIYNPFDLENIELLSNEKIFNINFEKFTFITAGRLDGGKNHQFLIKAFFKIKNKNTQLVILGEGVLKKEIEILINDLKLNNRVLMVGFDSNPYKYFSRSHCFVFSSNYEGFPNVLVEALACGLPIISTDCQSGPREILAPNTDVSFQLKDSVDVAKYGLLVPTNRENELIDAMELIIDDKSLQQNYQNNARDRAKSFDKDKIVNVFFEILNRG